MASSSIFTAWWFWLAVFLIVIVAIAGGLVVHRRLRPTDPELERFKTRRDELWEGANVDLNFLQNVKKDSSFVNTQLNLAEEKLRSLENLPVPPGLTPSQTASRQELVDQLRKRINFTKRKFASQ